MSATAGQPETPRRRLPRALRLLRFEDREDEAAWREGYFERSRLQFRYAIIMAIFLFLIFAPFDYYIVGGGRLERVVIVCWAARAILIAVLVALLWISETLPARHMTVLLLLSWTAALIALWFLSMQDDAQRTHEYLYAMTLLSLAASIYLPLLLVHAVLVQPLIFLPIASAWAVDRTGTSADVASFAFPAAILGSAAFYGVYSKFHTEKALRDNFRQHLALMRARDEADRASHVKSEFLATMSHEIRTPLNAILGNVRLLRHEAALSADGQVMLRDAERAGIAMKNLVNDVLDIARIESGEVASTFKPFQLDEIIADLDASLKVLAAAKGVRLDLPLPGRGHVLIGDAGRLRQILLNLLGNAVKFTRQGVVGLKVRVEPDRLLLLVHDTGVGIPADQRAEIFRPFFRAWNVHGGEFAGTGLGLAIVRRMTDALDGRLAVRSQLGAGTVFRLTLPFPPIEPAAAPSSVARAGAMTAGAPLRILVVEDDAATLAVITRFLKLDGHEVVEARTAAEALHLFEAHHVDCVLTDIRLPDLSGIALIERLRHSRRARQAARLVPVVATTADVLPEDLVLYRRSGFAKVVPKPFDEHELFACLAAIAAETRGAEGEAEPAAPAGLDEVDKVAESAPVAAPGAPAVVLDRLQGMVSREDYHEIQRCFARALAENRDGLRNARREGDASGVVFYAHRLKASLASFGHAGAATLAAEVEREVEDNRRIPAPALQGLEDALGRLAAEAAAWDEVTADSLAEEPDAARSVPGSHVVHGVATAAAESEISRRCSQHRPIPSQG